MYVFFFFPNGMLHMLQVESARGLSVTCTGAVRGLAARAAWSASVVRLLSNLPGLLTAVHSVKSSQVYLYSTFPMAYIDTLCFEWRDVIKLSKINKHTGQKKRQNKLHNNKKMECLKAKTCSHELKAKENKYILRSFLKERIECDNLYSKGRLFQRIGAQ